MEADDWLWWPGGKEKKKTKTVWEFQTSQAIELGLKSVSMHQKFNPKLFLVGCSWCRTCVELQPVTLLGWQTSAPCVTRRGAAL